MKIREDFVTNSSSSSFIIAKRPGWTDEQKQRILSVVEHRFLGKAVLKPGASEEEIDRFIKEEYFEEDVKEDIRKALADGKTVYTGVVDYEQSDYHLANIYQSVWNAMQGDNFDDIETDLSY